MGFSNQLLGLALIFGVLVAEAAEPRVSALEVSPLVIVLGLEADFRYLTERPETPAIAFLLNLAASKENLAFATKAAEFLVASYRDSSQPNPVFFPDGFDTPREASLRRAILEKVLSFPLDELSVASLLTDVLTHESNSEVRELAIARTKALSGPIHAAVLQALRRRVDSRLRLNGDYQLYWSQDAVVRLGAHEGPRLAGADCAARLVEGNG